MTSEQVVDYRNYDFRSVWVGRDDVDRFDRALVEMALPFLDGRRTLEIGTGFGRLSPFFVRGGGEYVGADFDLRGLHDARDVLVRSGASRAHLAWLGANAYHLPFASGSFTSVCLIRVHHHLADPLSVLREVGRVLVPGGTALLTFNARSLFRSVVHDLRVALRRPKVAGERRLLGARGDHVEVRRSPLLVYITRPSRFAADLGAAGLLPVRTFGGLETTGARLLPFSLARFVSRTWPGAPVFSSRWVVARKSGGPAEPCAWSALLRCPRCGAEGPPPEALAASPACPRCGFGFRWDNGVVDARYVPDPGPGAPDRAR
jgi:SAM-dependent methyltransferase